MVIATGRDLWGMGHRQDLTAGCQLAQAFAHRIGGPVTSFAALGEMRAGFRQLVKKSKPRSAT